MMKYKKEDILQINIVNWFKHEFPEFEDDIHAFANERYVMPNESGGYHQVGRKLKRMGVKRGVSDLFIAIPQGIKCGLWLELKVENGKLSKHQEEFIARKILMGYDALVVWDFEAAKKVILTYLDDYIKTFKKAPREQNIAQDC